MDVYFWKVLFDVLQHLFVPFQFEVWVQPALQQDLVSAEFDRFANFLKQNAPFEHIAFLAFRRTVERTEIANSGANVGVVDVAIDVVGPEWLRMHPK